MTTTANATVGQQLRHHLGILIRMSWFLAVCAVLAGGTALLLGLRQPPVYRATTLLVIDERAVGQGSYSNVLASNQSAATYATLITQPVVLQMAVSPTQSMSASSLANRVHATVQPETSVIELQVDDGSPARAATVANAIAVSFITLQQASAQASLQNSLQQLEAQSRDLATQQTALTARIAQVQGTDPSSPELPALRQRLAALVARQSTQDSVREQLTQEYFVSSNNVHVFQPAVPPTSPDHPKPFAYGAVGALLGLALAMGVVLLWGSALDAWSPLRLVSRWRWRPASEPGRREPGPRHERGPRREREVPDMTIDDAPA